MKKNNKGFTLIELLVVIAIIGLLSTLAVVALNSARMKSRDARRLSDVKQIQTALELYYNDQGRYPVLAAGGLMGQGNYACLDATGWHAAGACDAATTYMAQVPSYPSPRTDGCCGAAGGACPDGTDNDVGYFYEQVDADHSSYRIEYCMGGNSGGVDAGERVACESGIQGCSDPN